jgi:cell wall-associated NlpC family hydrolase
MRTASRPSPLGIAPLGLLLLTSCAQSSFNQSAMDVLSSVVLAGSSSSGSRSTPASASAARILNTADDYLGVPYKWGGTSPETGFDCSGYVRFVFARQGVQLPRTSREQAGAGQGVTARVSQLRQGDIMLFAETRKPISHVAIYAGDGRIIHSSSSGGGVRFDDLGTKRGQWFVQHMVAARRLTSDGRSLVQSLEFLARPNSPLDPPDNAPPPR